MKFNKDDIMVCNKTYKIKEEEETYIYNESDVWIIKSIDLKSKVYIVAASPYNKEEINWFSIYELETYWITLAEWRDKQINQILED